MLARHHDDRDSSAGMVAFGVHLDCLQSTYLKARTSLNTDALTEST